VLCRAIAQADHLTLRFEHSVILRTPRPYPARYHRRINTQTSASTTELARFVDEAKRNGLPDDALVPLLRQNGWSERRVYETLSAYYGTLLGIRLPSRSGPAENAQDAFLYLLNFITLAFWTTALGQIFYTLIERSFPDATAYMSGALIDRIAWQLATVIVAFPIFALINRLIERSLRRRPDLLDSPVRSWLTYIALVGAALVVLADGIWFVEAWLRGNLTIHFLLDSVVLLVIGGGVFCYYLVGLRRSAADR
jgi:hypothetical protein